MKLTIFFRVIETLEVLLYFNKPIVYRFLTIQILQLFCTDRDECYNILFFQHQAHFEWVVGYEKLLEELALEVFDTLGVNDKASLDIAVNRLEEFLEDLGNNVDTLVKEVLTAYNV